MWLDLYSIWHVLYFPIICATLFVLMWEHLQAHPGMMHMLFCNETLVQQAAEAGHHHHHPPLGMPTGAVDMSRGAAGGQSATLAQGVGVTPAGAGQVRV